jgi:hypothetical protein
MFQFNRLYVYFTFFNVHCAIQDFCFENARAMLSNVMKWKVQPNPRKMSMFCNPCPISMRGLSGLYNLQILHYRWFYSKKIPWHYASHEKIHWIQLYRKKFYEYDFHKISQNSNIYNFIDHLGYMTLYVFLVISDGKQDHAASRCARRLCVFHKPFPQTLRQPGHESC